jgi:hypothetical protein
LFRRDVYKSKGHSHGNLSYISVPIKTSSVALVTVNNAAKSGVLGFGDYTYTVMFSDGPPINFDTKILIRKCYNVSNFPAVTLWAR